MRHLLKRIFLIFKKFCNLGWNPDQSKMNPFKLFGEKKISFPKSFYICCKVPGKVTFVSFRFLQIYSFDFILICQQLNKKIEKYRKKI